ncbi:haloacid dehalogenase [Thermotoga sp. Ku-13t]|nr:haloacid dehalogenase [Thermotoga sp. Ku-13t]
MKLFIFDVGGVLYDGTSVANAISVYLGLSREEFLTLARFAGLRKLQTGKINSMQFWSNFSKISGRRVDEDLWVRFFRPVLRHEVANLIKKLKAKYRVVAGTNTIESHYQVHLVQGHYSVFDQVYASHQIGFVKPDVEFFLYILEKEKMEPEETLFVDDTPENVAGAQRIGIHSVLFVNVQDLAERLSSLIEE